MQSSALDIQPNQIYRHYLSSGSQDQIYRIIGCGRQEGSDELVVVYQSIWADAVEESAGANLSVTPLSKFQDVVSHHGQLQPRFQLLDAAPIAKTVETDLVSQPKSSPQSALLQSEYLILTADGGSRGNPGPSAYGFAVWTLDPSLAQPDRLTLTALQAQMIPNQLLYSTGSYIGRATNNQAEWQGVLEGLRYLALYFSKTRKLYICLDSDLVVKQLRGQYQVKHPDLKPLHRAAKDILTNFQAYQVEHIYREFNTMADQMVNQALDALR